MNDNYEVEYYRSGSSDIWVTPANSFGDAVGQYQELQSLGSNARVMVNGKAHPDYTSGSWEPTDFYDPKDEALKELKRVHSLLMKFWIDGEAREPSRVNYARKKLREAENMVIRAMEL